MVVIITVISLPLNGVEAAGIYSNITNEAINAMNLPACIVVDDSGNIYEAELNGEKIQKFDAMHTFVGAWGTSDSGNMDFFNPNGIAYYAGYIYLADTMNWCIKKINASTGEFVSKYGDGSSYFPYGIAIDGVGGYIYVADTLYSVVHKLKLSDGSTVVEWNASGAIYGEPNAVAVGSDGIYVADRANNTIIKLDATTGDIDTSWGDSGSIGGYGAGNSNLNSPRGVAVDSSDNIYVADSGNNRIMKFESTGEYITKWGIFGTGDGQFSNPNNVAVDSNGIIYVADTENNRVVVIDSVLPTISSSTAVAASNEYIDVTFSEAVRGASDGTTKIDASKFGVNFIQGSGTATDASITSITKTGGGEIDGSETTVRFYLNVLGTSNGLETIEIKPIDGNSVYDKAGNAMLAEQTGGVKNLKDLTAPEMNVKGNNTSIADGDTTPETADHTDFSTADITGGTVVRTFTIANTGTANLNLTGTTKIVEVSGANASDFTVTQPLSATVAALGTITFYVTFDPTETGLETANISISNNDSNENPYNFSIQGTGTVTNAVAPTIATQPVAKTVNVNAAASLSVAASASGTLSYQWYSNTTASTTGASAINTATSAAYSAPTSTVGTTYYYCVVTNTDDTKSGITVATTTSDIVAVITNSLTDAVAPTITTQLQNATVNVGGTATLSVVASATSGTLTYQWYSNSTNTTSGAIAINTATSASYTAPTNTIGTNYYYCIVTNTDSNASGNTTSTATTNAAKVVVNELTNAAAPTIATQPVAKTVNVNATASLSVAASASGTLSYQWYSNTTNSTTGASAIATAISATYQVPTSSAGTTYYYCVVTNTDNAKTGIKVATNTSAIVAVTVNELTNATAPTITTQLQDKTVSINEANELSVTAASSSGILTYQWYSNSNDSTNGAVAITNATGAAIQVPTDILGTTYYFCIVTNTDSSASGTTTATATTNAAKVVVNELTNATAPTITTQLQNKIVSINEAVELSVTASSSGILTYQWYSNTENSTIGSVEITNTTGAAIQVPTNTTGTTYYYCIITSTDNTKTGANTATATSAIVAVTVNENVVPTTYILTYTAEANGTITGTAAQTVEQGASGSTVTATPNSGYHFVKWSDDVTAATRTDSNVAGNIAVSASFAINESSPSPDTTPTPPKNLPASTGVNILVNGVVQTAATSETTKVDDKTVTTVTIDDKKIEEKLKNEGNNAIITIPVNNNSDVVVGQLNGQTVKNMETKEAVLEIKTENVTYTLPASQINIDSVSKQIGEQVLLKDITVNVSISKSSDKTAQIVEDTANKNNYQLVVKPIDFEITCTSGGKTVDVSRFNGYVQRTAAIPDGVDPTKITTGIVLNNDGTFSHVPTQIITINGKLFAKINSLTNSTYSVLWHPLEFKDVEKHWAKEAINDMGSRLVITGIGDDNFAPNRDIIRAEFAAIIVKALGLKPLAGKNTFSDVNETAWYSQYVETAYEYNIIAGVGKGKFAPTDMITREQAVTMIAKAMKITNLKTVLAAGEIDSLLKEYSDTGKTAAWAKENVAICIKNGIISGKGKLVAPKDNITRAEVAVIVRKLLQKSNLIN